MTESPTHRVLAKLHKLPQNKNKPLIKNHLHYWKADYTSFHLISQSASGNIKAKCQASTFPLLPQADLSVVMAFPICSQLLCSLFWLTSVTETRLISLLKIHRGRISAWREILGCDPGDGMDVWLPEPRLARKVVWNKHRDHLQRLWKTRSVSTLAYLNRAETWLAVTFPAGKLWGLVQRQQVGNASQECSSPVPFEATNHFPTLL